MDWDGDYCPHEIHCESEEVCAARFRANPASMPGGLSVD